MYFVEVNPRKFTAIQFNKEGDIPGIKRGYCQTRGTHVALYISDSMPRSPDCRFCYVMELGSERNEVQLTDWVLTNVKNGKVKVYPLKDFLKKFVGYTDPSDGVVRDSEATK